MMYHLSIDYTEGDKDSYRGIVVTRSDETQEAKRWMTGDPQADWAAYVDWAIANKVLVIQSSSITHFYQDVPGWREIIDENGREMLVPEDRPQLIAYEAAIAAGLSEELADEAARKVMEAQTEDN